MKTPYCLLALATCSTLVLACSGSTQSSGHDASDGGMKISPAALDANVGKAGTGLDLDVESVALLNAEKLTFFAVVRNVGEQTICRPNFQLFPGTAQGEVVIEVTNRIAMFAAPRLLENGIALPCLKPGERGVFYDDRQPFLAGKSFDNIERVRLEVSGLDNHAEAPAFELTVADDHVEKQTLAEGDAWRVTGKLATGGPATGAAVQVFPQDAEGFVFGSLLSEVFDHSAGGSSDTFTTSATATAFNSYLSFVTWVAVNK